MDDSPAAGPSPDPVGGHMTTTEPECDGLCVDSSDIGVPGFGIAYPHPGCPLHDPGNVCRCGTPDRCLSPTHMTTTWRTKETPMPDLDEVLDPAALWDVFSAAAINNVYATCPYLLKNDEQGAYGPNTCHGGCHEEPECVTGGPHVVQDEMEAVADYLRRALTEGDTP